MKYDHGDLVKDKITGCEGIITAITTFITGCIHYHIQPKTQPNGYTPDIQKFDESRLILIEKKVIDKRDLK